MDDVCVVTVVHRRHDHLGHQLRLLAGSDPGSAHVVVAMDDPDIDDVVRRWGGGRQVEVLHDPGHPDGLPLARARNAGVDRAIARGAALVVLLDVDCLAGEGALLRYAAAAGQVSSPALLAGAVTYLPEGTRIPPRAGDLTALRSPHPARPDPAEGVVLRGGAVDLFWSLSAAFTPTTWALLGGFCEDYTGYGGEDTDLGRVARERGADLVWVGGADAYHQYHPVSSPPVEHVDAIVRNAHVFHRRWGTWPMQGWLREFAAGGLVRWDGEVLERT